MMKAVPEVVTLTLPGKNVPFGDVSCSVNSVEGAVQLTYVLCEALIDARFVTCGVADTSIVTASRLQLTVPLAGAGAEASASTSSPGRTSSFFTWSGASRVLAHLSATGFPVSQERGRLRKYWLGQP
jgi:hypothetical protein